MKISSYYKLVFVFALTAISCSKKEVSDPETSRNEIAGTSSLLKGDEAGEAIFREIFFLQGDVTEKIPYLADIQAEKNALFKSDSNLANQWNQMTDEVINIIKTDDPRFMENFKLQVESDDLYTVKSALENAGRAIQKAQYGSETYRNMFVIGEFMINDPELKAKVEALDLKTDEGRIEFERLIKENESLANALIPCTPVYAFCVAHSIAAVSATALAAANVAAYLTVIAKTAMFLWDKVKIFKSAAQSVYFVDEILISEVAEAY